MANLKPNRLDNAMKTIEGIGNALLLEPEEAAGIGLFNPLFVERGGQVDEWSPLGAPSPCMLGGTGLAVIGYNRMNFLLCVRRERLSEVERLRKVLYEFLVSHGYVEAFLRWESGLLSGGTDGCPLRIEGDVAASGGAGCDFDDVVCIDGDRRTAGGGEVDELGHADSVAEV